MPIFSIRTNGLKPYAALITGDDALYHYKREFCPRIRQAARKTGVAQFAIPDGRWFVELCFGEKDSRRFFEVEDDHFREIREPGGDAKSDWAAFPAIINPPAPVTMEEW